MPSISKAPDDRANNGECRYDSESVAKKSDAELEPLDDEEEEEEEEEEISNKCQHGSTEVESLQQEMDEEEIAISNTEKSEQPLASDCEQNSGDDESTSTSCDSNEEAITNAEKTARPLAIDCEKNSGDKESIGDHSNEETTLSKKKFKNYNGVYWIAAISKFRAKLIYNKNVYYLGQYQLQSDAAWAADLLGEFISGIDWKPNFGGSFETYVQSRELELEETGCSIDEVRSIDDVLCEINTRVDKVKASNPNLYDPDITNPTKRREKERGRAIPKKASIYNYVTIHKATGNWKSAITLHGKRYSGGYFGLQSDCAWSSDHVSKLIEGPTQNINFASVEDYRQARAEEIQELQKQATQNGATAVDIASEEDVTREIRKRLRKIKDSNVVKHLKKRKGVSTQPHDSGEEDATYSDAQQPKQKEKKSAYMDVYYTQATGGFVARVQDGRNRRRHMGKYMLESDAALSVDKLNEAMKEEGTYRTNFTSMEDYKKARTLEMEVAGTDEIDVGSIDEVLSRIQSRIDKINAKPAPKAKSLYKNVFWIQSASKFRTLIRHKSIPYSVGSFTLQADAGLAADKLAKCIPNYPYTWVNNFASMDSYQEARTRELEETGKSVDQDRVLSEIDTRIDQIKLDIANDGKVPISSLREPSKLGKKTSIYQGVHFCNKESKFIANVCTGGKTYRIGSFVCESDAALAADELKSNIGHIHRLNFGSFDVYRNVREEEVANIDSNLHHIFTVEQICHKIRSRAQVLMARIVAAGCTVQNQKSVIPTKNDTSLDQEKAEPADPNTSDAELSENEASREESNVPTKQKSHSFNSTTANSANDKKFECKIFANCKEYYLGSFDLEADAAKASDDLLIALGLSSSELNFPSLESYEKARAVEFERICKTEKDVGSIVEVLDFIKDRIATIQEGMQKSGPESTNLTATAGNSVSSPKGKTSAINSAAHQNASEQSKAETSPSKASDHGTNPASDLIALPSDSNLPFPIGCIVITNFTPNDRGEYYKKGDMLKVTGAYISIASREVFYSISKTDGGTNDASMINENQLAFAPGCSVKYSPSKSFNASDCAQGSIFLCQTKRKRRAVVDELNTTSTGQHTKFYTVIIFRDGSTSSFEVVEDVASYQLSYNEE